jgi:hypothetical protein
MRKNSQLSVRITDEEMLNLRSLADRESVLLSQLVRNIVATNTGPIEEVREQTARPLSAPAAEQATGL